jgi:uncharacterized protein
MRHRNMFGNMSTVPQPPDRAPVARCLSILATGLFVAAILIGTGAASGQSFDCRKARSADEMTICQESGLAQLDQELASLKRQRKEKHHKAEHDEADDNETPFLNARRRCGENHACIEQSYRNRIRELTQAVPDADPERPGRHADSKRSDRQKTVKRNGGKTEDQRTEAEDAKRGATETAIASPGRTTDQSETGPVSGLPPEVETRPRHKDKAGASSAIPTPPSKQEAEAAIAGMPLPEERSRQKHRGKAVSATTPFSPEREPPPTDTGAAAEHPRPGDSDTWSEHKTKARVGVHSKRDTTTAIAAPPAPDREVQPSDASAAPVGRQRSGAHGSDDEMTGSEPPKQRSKRGAPATAQPAAQPAPAGAPTIPWINPPPSH